jgi:predicted acyl esterase
LVEAGDGTDLFVETWLPAAKGRHVPPRRVPTVVVMTPYAREGAVTETYVRALEWLVPRGYAYSVMHLRGTGSSGGCMDFFAHDADDGAQVVEYLGRSAAWTTGRVGAFGYSYPGTTQLAVAGHSDRSKTRYLKAIVAGAAPSGMYDGWNFDGVPRSLHGAVEEGVYGDISLFPYTGPFNVVVQNRDTDEFIDARTSEGGNLTPAQAVERPGCHPENVAAATDTSGDFTTYHASRDFRAGVPRIRAATLMFQGSADTDVLPIHVAGIFDRITAPKFGMFGVWGHALPDSHPLREEWERADFERVVVAWYDRWLKGIRNGVDGWPAAQVQGTDGQWRAEPNWPTTGGPVGHLALGADGVLATSTPAGASTYTESLPLDEEVPARDPNGALAFETAPVAARLEITGTPVLDVWVELDRQDAHLAAEIETFDAAGEPIVAGSTIGFRSMRHLGPFVDGGFRQEQGEAPPVGEPIRVAVRFNPTDLVIPKGGTLRLTISGSERMAPGVEGAAGLPSIVEQPSWPSMSFTTVTVLHDCAHPSALRFLMPRKNPRLLNVREPDEKGPLRTLRGPAPESDAGGLARAHVCGKRPIRLPGFGPSITY